MKRGFLPNVPECRRGPLTYWGKYNYRVGFKEQIVILTHLCQYVFRRLKCVVFGARLRAPLYPSAHSFICYDEVLLPLEDRMPHSDFISMLKKKRLKYEKILVKMSQSKRATCAVTSSVGRPLLVDSLPHIPGCVRLAPPGQPTANRRSRRRGLNGLTSGVRTASAVEQKLIKKRERSHRGVGIIIERKLIFNAMHSI